MYEDVPVAKLSTAKTTRPGSKQVWRLPDWSADVVALREEEGPAGADPLLAEVMRAGRRIGSHGLAEAASCLRTRAGGAARRPPDAGSAPYRVASSRGWSRWPGGQRLHPGSRAGGLTPQVRRAYAKAMLAMPTTMAMALVMMPAMA